MDESAGGFGLIALGMVVAILGWIIGGIVAGAMGTLVGVLIGPFVFGICLWAFFEIRNYILG